MSKWQRSVSEYIWVRASFGVVNSFTVKKVNLFTMNIRLGHPHPQKCGGGGGIYIYPHPPPPPGFYASAGARAHFSLFRGTYLPQFGVSIAPPPPRLKYFKY